ncbi:Decaprenyl diphosphate synthase-like [Dillenia turbinata]|uniref:Alkyl transferase n=1 Tax=Dillenia turbinata TaxID=194707 RepID=A0AAN8ZIQ9_9MAGN
MLTLRFRISIDPTFPPPHKPRPSPSLSRSNFLEPHFFVFPTSSRPKFHQILATALNVAIKEENEEVKKGFHGDGDSPESAKLPVGLRHDLMPKHVAVIMDGNVRWAQKRGLPESAGHQSGVRWGIRVLTVFSFSNDNWFRPNVQVDFLMSLFERRIKSELDNFIREGIRISVIGDSSKLPDSLSRLIKHAEETTKDNSRLQLIVAASYSGKYDILQARKSVARKVKDDFIQLEDINEALIEQELETNCTEFPYPDLLIRTSGELRVSNFLLWQLAYTEFFFAQALWPDFGEPEFIEALTSYQQRQRRYGGRSS